MEETVLICAVSLQFQKRDCVPRSRGVFGGETGPSVAEARRGLGGRGARIAGRSSGRAAEMRANPHIFGVDFEGDKRKRHLGVNGRQEAGKGDREGQGDRAAEGGSGRGGPQSAPRAAVTPRAAQEPLQPPVPPPPGVPPAAWGPARSPTSPTPGFELWLVRPRCLSPGHGEPLFPPLPLCPRLGVSAQPPGRLGPSAGPSPPPAPGGAPGLSHRTQSVPSPHGMECFSCALPPTPPPSPSPTRPHTCKPCPQCLRCTVLGVRSRGRKWVDSPCSEEARSEMCGLVGETSTGANHRAERVLCAERCVQCR